MRAIGCVAPQLGLDPHDGAAGGAHQLDEISPPLDEGLALALFESRELRQRAIGVDEIPLDVDHQQRRSGDFKLARHAMILSERKLCM
jgi:hypothetical protein